MQWQVEMVVCAIVERQRIDFGVQNNPTSLLIYPAATVQLLRSTGSLGQRPSPLRNALKRRDWQSQNPLQQKATTCTLTVTQIPTGFDISNKEKLIVLTAGKTVHLLELEQGLTKAIGKAAGVTIEFEESPVSQINEKSNR